MATSDTQRLAVEASIFQDICDVYRNTWGSGDVAKVLAQGSHLPLGGAQDLPLQSMDGPLGASLHARAWRRATSAVNRLVRQAYAQYELSLWGLRPAEAMRGAASALLHRGDGATGDGDGDGDGATGEATGGGDGESANALAAPPDADTHPYDAYERSGALFSTVAWCGVVALDLFFKRPGWSELRAAANSLPEKDAHAANSSKKRLEDLAVMLRAWLRKPGMTTVVVATSKPLTCSELHPSAVRELLVPLIEWKEEVREHVCAGPRLVAAGNMFSHCSLSSHSVCVACVCCVCLVCLLHAWVVLCADYCAPAVAVVVVGAATVPCVQQPFRRIHLVSGSGGVSAGVATTLVAPGGCVVPQLVVAPMSLPLVSFGRTDRHVWTGVPLRTPPRDDLLRRLHAVHCRQEVAPAATAGASGDGDGDADGTAAEAAYIDPDLVPRPVTPSPEERELAVQAWRRDRAALPGDHASRARRRRRLAWLDGSLLASTTGPTGRVQGKLAQSGPAAAPAATAAAGTPPQSHVGGTKDMKNRKQPSREVLERGGVPVALLDNACVTGLVMAPELKGPAARMEEKAGGGGGGSGGGGGGGGVANGSAARDAVDGGGEGEAWTLTVHVHAVLECCHKGEIRLLGPGKASQRLLRLAHPPAQLIVGPVVGHVGARTARVLGETDAPAVVRCVATDVLAGIEHVCTLALGDGPGVARFSTLDPHRRYTVAFEGVANGEERVGCITTRSVAPRTVNLVSIASPCLPPSERVHAIDHEYPLADPRFTAAAQGAVHAARGAVHRARVAAARDVKRAVRVAAAGRDSDAQSSAPRGVGDPIVLEEEGGLGLLQAHEAPHLWRRLFRRVTSPWGGVDGVVHLGGQVNVRQVLETAHALLEVAEDEAVKVFQESRRRQQEMYRGARPGARFSDVFGNEDGYAVDHEYVPLGGGGGKEEAHVVAVAGLHGCVCGGVRVRLPL